MRSVFLHLPCFTAFWLATLAASVPSRRAMADEVVVSIDSGAGVSSPPARDESLMPNPFGVVTHLDMAIRAGRLPGLLYMQPGEGGAEQDVFSAAAVAPRVSEATVAGRGDGTSPAGTGAPEEAETSAFRNIAVRNATLPGLAALGIIGLALVYGASNGNKQGKKRRAQERQRTRGFRQMAAPIYARNKRLRVRLSSEAKRDANR